MNVFCALSKEGVHGPFFCVEATINGLVSARAPALAPCTCLDEEDQEGRFTSGKTQRVPRSRLELGRLPRLCVVS
jgi:hypothetical protein